MRTPSGIDCQYFFGDYYRGRNREECRLLAVSNSGNEWKADLCKTCPVPGILRANACPNMVLKARVERIFWVFSKRVSVTAECKLTQKTVAEPHIGCGQCHPLPPEFSGKLK